MPPLSHVGRDQSCALMTCHTCNGKDIFIMPNLHKDTDGMFGTAAGCAACGQHVCMSICCHDSWCAADLVLLPCKPWLYAERNRTGNTW